jgi:putative peptide zinc metalloprotease protein
MGKLFTHLVGPNVMRNRTRAIAVTVIGLLTPLLLLAMVPWRDAIRAPGIVEAVDATVVTPGMGGWLAEYRVRNGDRVEAGQVIAVLVNPELDFDRRLVRQQIIETELLRNQALAQTPADVIPLERRLSVLRERETELESRAAQLVVRARHLGNWVAPQQAERVGTWISRGESLGQLVDLDRLRFVAVVTQQQADRLFATEVDRVAIRLAGQVDREVVAESVNILPYQRQRLASPVLGWMGGGKIPVRQDDQRGETAAESFYEIRVGLDSLPTGLVTLHGQSGLLRLSLEASPLLTQWRKALMQQLQKRYQI